MRDDMGQQEYIKEKPQDGPIKVLLLKQHSHAGFDHEAGEEIEVTHAQADWLKALGVI